MAEATLPARASGGRRRRTPGLLWRDPGLLLALLVVATTIALFVLYPLVQILSQGFFSRRGELDLSAYGSILSRPVYQTIILNTLQLGLITAVSSTAIGFLFAYTLARVPGRVQGFLRVVAFLPLVSPPFAVAIASILLFGRSGLISKGVFGIEYNIYGLPGLILVQALTFFPVSMLIFDGLLKQLDASLEEAAEGLGASRGRIFRTVTLPLMMPGLLGSLLISFIESLADLGNPIFIGGDFNVLASQSWIAIIGQSNFQLGAALSVVLLVPSLVAFAFQRYYLERHSFIAVTGKPTGGRVRIREAHIALPLQAACLLIAALVLLLYGALFYGGLVRVWGGDFSLSLEHFASALQRGQQAFGNTMLLAVVATPLTALLGTVIAVLVVRRRFVGREALDFVSMMGAAVPGTVLGIGFILAFNRPPLVLTGTALIIVLAFMVRGLPAGLRAAVAALQQIDPSLDEASTNLGADAVTTFRRVTLPLIRPALLAGMVFSFTRNMTAISAIIFLASPGWKILTKEIFDLIDVHLLGDAIALTCLLVLLVIGVMGLLHLLLGRDARSREVVGLEAGR